MGHRTTEFSIKCMIHLFCGHLDSDYIIDTWRKISKKKKKFRALVRNLKQKRNISVLKNQSNDPAKPNWMVNISQPTGNLTKYRGFS